MSTTEPSFPHHINAAMERLISWEDAVYQGIWREAGSDILVIPFLTERFCHDLIQVAEHLGGFRPLESDVKNNAAPGQEMRLNRIHIKIAEQFDKYMRELVAPILRTHWWPLTLGKTRMPFLLRYSPETQPALDMHHDSAMVSFTIMLNEGYEGGALSFPRQHWDSRDAKLGDVIAFPSRVTHVHWVTPVTRGIRYAIATWIIDPNGTADDLIFP